MPSRPKPPWPSNKLIRRILAPYKKHSPPDRLDSETKSLVVVLEEPQQTADSACTSEKINFLGVETRMLGEDRFDRGFDGVAWVAGGIGVFEVLPGVLWKLSCFCAWVPEGWCAFVEWSIMVDEVLFGLCDLPGKMMDGALASVQL